MNFVPTIITYQKQRANLGQFFLLTTKSSRQFIPSNL